MANSAGSQFRELLCADVAVTSGLVGAREAAQAVRAYWESAEASGVIGYFVRSGLVTPEGAAKITTAVERLIGAAGGASDALRERGGLSRSIHEALGEASPGLSRAVAKAGAGVRVPLRAVVEGRYLDLAPIGSGGMGVVYVALDAEMQREVAFKILRPDVGTPGARVTPARPLEIEIPADAREALEASRARFLSEAWITGALEHPGVVPVYEIGETARGLPYYTMRLVRGVRTLLDALTQAKSLDERIGLLEPFLKVCDTVRYAHAQGVLHRDLKPQNVALGAYGEVVVLDWGLATLKATIEPGGWQERVRRRAGSVTGEGDVEGTPGYLSPEAAAGEAVDERADVYELGAMLFEVLTGRLPFAIEPWWDYLEACRTKEAPTARSLDDAVPEGLSRIAAKALARDRQDRYPDVGALAEAIRTWQRETALEREVAGLLDESNRALERARARTDAGWPEDAERAEAAAGQVLRIRPSAAVAGTLLEAIRALRATRTEAEKELARHNVRRRVVRRAAITTVSLLVAATATFFIGVRIARRSEALREARAELSRASESIERAERLRASLVRDHLTPDDLVGRERLAFDEEQDEATRARLSEDTTRARGLEFEAREAEFETLDALASAERLLAPYDDDAAAVALRATRVRFLFSRWRSSTEVGDEIAAAEYRRQLADPSLDGPDGPVTRQIGARTAVEIVCDRPDAEVHLFRYESMEQAPGAPRRSIPRLVPVPWALASAPSDAVLDPMQRGCWPGRRCLLVTAVEPDSPAARAGWQADDLVLEVGGYPADERARVGGMTPDGPAALAGCAVGDPIHRIAQTQVRDLLHWRVRWGDLAETHGDRRVATAPGAEVLAMIGSREVRAEAPTSAMATTLGIVDVVDCARLLRGPAPRRLDVVGVHDGHPISLRTDVGRACGLTVEETAYPLPLSSASRLPRERAVPLALPPGSYLVVARAPGHETLRVPVLVDRSPGAGVAPLRVDARLHPIGFTPPGYVWVAPGPFIWGGDRKADHARIPAERPVVDGFFMARTELVSKVWREYLEDNPGAEACSWKDCAAILDRQVVGDDEVPVGRVSFADARAFLGWYATRLARADPPFELPAGFEPAMPTEFEWEKAARGVDGRAFPWGDRYDLRLVFGAAGSRDAIPNVGAACAATDESVYGVRDLAGSRSEWTETEFSGDRANNVVKGGAHGVDGQRSRAAHREFTRSRGTTKDLGVGNGLRLVLRRARPGADGRPPR